jgi:hypothetical protein
MLSQWDQKLCSKEALFIFNFTIQENTKNKRVRFGSHKKRNSIYLYMYAIRFDNKQNYVSLFDDSC